MKLIRHISIAISILFAVVQVILLMGFNPICLATSALKLLTCVAVHAVLTAVRWATPQSRVILMHYPGQKFPIEEVVTPVTDQNTLEQIYKLCQFVGDYGKAIPEVIFIVAIFALWLGVRRARFRCLWWLCGAVLMTVSLGFAEYADWLIAMSRPSGFS